MKNIKKRIISIILAVIMLVGLIPSSVFAAPASDIPKNMLDHSILRSLAYTGYDVEAQKADGTIYQTSSISSRTPASVLSDISYGTSTTGFETVANSSTKTGLAPNIAKFEQSGLCCASFVTYYICNYLPNIEGVNTRFITDAVKGIGMNSQAVETWEKALGQLSAAGKLEKIGTSSSNVDRTKLTTGDVRYPLNCRRASKISGKYKGGVFCKLEEELDCLCTYSPYQCDEDFNIGDQVIVAITQYDYTRKLVYGKIVAKW